MKLPLTPEQLPAVDALVLDAILVEHSKSTTAMGLTLRTMGWSPVQVAYCEDHWSWPWMAKAVYAERQKRGLGVVHASALDQVRAQQPEVIQARAEAAWIAEHGEEPAPPRPLVAASGVQIQLPPRPATTATASGYALPPVDPESQSERL